MKDRTDLLPKTESDLFALFPLLDGETETPWMCDTETSGTDRGTPILKQWAYLWTKEHREQIKVEESGTGEKIEGLWSE